MLVTIKQGESFPFSFTLDETSGWSCVITLKRYPADTPLVNRAVTLTDDTWSGFLTNSETKDLAVGQYLLLATLTKGTEKEVLTDRFHVGTGW